ncbi:MAG: cytochrome c biogenesis protein CcdA [Candidatus Nanopelagicales bacterium]
MSLAVSVDSVGSIAFGSITQTVTSGSLLLAIPLAIAAGLVSFLSPCVLPLVPGYLSFITGLTGAEIASEDGKLDARGRTRILLGCVLFIAGFSVVFIALGAAFGALSGWLFEYQTTIQRVLGVFVIVLGLMFGGWIPGLQREWRIHRAPTYGLWGAPLLGLAFGLGWTPCIGPTLSVVLSLAANEGSAPRGALLSLAYCVGLGIPFIIVGLAFGRVAGTLQWVRSHYLLVMRVGGAMLVLVGVLLVTGLWDQLMIWLRVWVGGFGVPI